MVVTTAISWIPSSVVTALLVVLINLPFMENFVFIAAGNMGESLLRVHLPQILRNENLSYDHRKAQFGSQILQRESGSITAPLYYVNSTYCNVNHQQLSSTNQSPETTTMTTTTTTTISYFPARPFASGMPFLLMINRGECSFVQKVRNAQHMGAVGVLIADNMCLCSDMNCRNETNGGYCESDEPTMADDGSGSDVTIPGFLIFKHDADVFKETIVHGNQTMRVEMSFPPKLKSLGASSVLAVSAPARKVTMDYWMSPGDPQSWDFLLRFEPLANAFASCIDFTPHMHLMDGTESGCLGQPSLLLPTTPTQSTKQGSNDNNINSSSEWEHLPCFNLCTNRGRYCAADPDGMDGGVSGADVVTESLRELCIWDYYTRYMVEESSSSSSLRSGRSSSSSSSEQESYRFSSLWWQYLIEFHQTCVTTNNMSSWPNNKNACVDQVYQKLGLSKDVIDRCMRDSGDLTSNHMNNKLDMELQIQKKEYIYMLPTLRIENVHFDVSVSKMHHVFNEICSSCGHVKSPAICEGCRSCHDISACVARGGSCPTTSTGMNTPLGVKASSLTTQQQQQQQVTTTGELTIHTFVSSILLLLTLTVIVAMTYHNRAQRKARQHVRDIMAHYIPLNG